MRAAAANSLRQSMAWLHTWVGLLLGWVLYFMFITGTAGYLDTEIDRWMTPEAPVANFAVPAERVIDTATDYLTAHAPGAERWLISLPTDRHTPYPRVFWSGAQGENVDARGNRQLDLSTGTTFETRETGGGQTLYQMHWRLHYLPAEPAYWIVGVATMFMFVALITGIIVHKKIFADFFTFRFGKGQRSWLDAHNVVSVLTIPFQLMITWSGLIFMMFTYMPLVIAAWYGPGEENRQVFFDEVFTAPALVEPSGESAQMVNLNQVLAEAQHLWAGAPITSLDIRHPGDAHARVIVRGSAATGPLRAAHLLVFDGINGNLLEEKPALESASKGLRDLLLGLHEGLFAGPLLRALYVLSGLLGAAMIATGSVLWAVKRRQQLERRLAAPHFGLRLGEKLNVATIIGLPLAVAAYFWANRVLPLDMPNRADWGVHCLFGIWLLMFVHACIRPTARVWQEQCQMAAVAYCMVPLLNALTTDRHLLASLAAGDWVFAGFDLSMLAIGLVFAGLARHLTRKTKRANTAKVSRPAPQPGTLVEAVE